MKQMKTTAEPHVILASASIGRKTLLQKLGVPFQVMLSDINEYNLTDIDVYKKIAKRARAKADNIYKRIAINVPTSSKKTKPFTLDASPYIIIAADSEAVLVGKSYGKSRDKAHTKEMLAELMGQTHEFVTATCIINFTCHPKHSDRSNQPTGRERKIATERTGRYVPSLDFSGRTPRNDIKVKEINRWENTTKTRVTLRRLTNAELTDYLTRYDFYRFAAAYTLNETPWDLVTKIDGSYTNVIGLPFEVLLPILRKVQLI